MRADSDAAVLSVSHATSWTGRRKPAGPPPQQQRPMRGRSSAAGAQCEREMSKQTIRNDRFADPQLIGSIIVGTVGLGFLIAEAAMLSLQGDRSSAIPLLAILIAATLSSIAGFAFSALCGALLFHLMDSPVYAVQVMIVCSIAIQLFCVATLWQSIDWRSLPVFLIGGVFGVPLGAYLLLNLPTGIYRHVIGALLIAYGVYLLMRLPVRQLRGGRFADAFVGFLGGFTGGLAGFPGASVTIWCALKGWDKARQRGVYQPFILCMQPVSLIVISLMRPPSAIAPQLDFRTLAFIPAALLGAWFGLRIFRRLSDRQFEIAVNLLLVIAGFGLIL
jgi:uncharacterized protein